VRDGTNDVGALKHAHVGVAILSSAPLARKRQPKTDEQVRFEIFDYVNQFCGLEPDVVMH
jgi:magnesium-transporting ATPase (P-type)